MAVVKLLGQRGMSAVAVQSVVSRGPSSIARSPALVSVAPVKLQQQRWRASLRRRVVPVAAARGIASANSVVGSPALANAGTWGSFAGLRAERVGRKKEVVKTERGKRTYRTVAAAETRDGRVCCGKFM